MTAKSAPQLLHVPVTSAPQARRTLLLLTLAVVMAAVAWLFEGQPMPVSAEAAPAHQGATANAVETEGNIVPASSGLVPAENSRHRALSEFLAKRYRVSQAITFDLVSMAHAAGHQIGLDPLLIIAVMAVESRFNPIAESVMGAKGLMQVIPKYHLEKFREFGGEKYAVFDPETNILVGTRILKDYLAKTGSVDSALQLYVGAVNADEDPYIEKVMDEKQRLQQVLKKAKPRPELEASVAGERLASATQAR